MADAVAHECDWAGAVLVLDLPCLLMYEVRAGEAEVHLGMVAELDHSAGDIGGATAPASDASFTVTVGRGVGSRVSTHALSVSDSGPQVSV